MSEEIWREYKRNNVNVWEVSNYGNVKKNGEPYECGLNNNGYKMFAHNLVHKAVAELFIPNVDNKTQVDHINTDRLNNNVDNLRWVTPKENQNNTLTKQHMREAKIGKHLSEEHKQKIGEAGKGRKHTDETKQHISEANKADKHYNAKKCVYNEIEFGCIKDAYDYAVKNCGYDKSYRTFCKHY